MSVTPPSLDPGTPRRGKETSMNDTQITLQGWLGSDVTVRRATDVPVGSFRLACTPRRFNRRTQNWSDGATQWYTVTVWRALADNCAASLRRGDPVVVHGRLELRTYVNAHDVEVSSLEVEATHVGHDLSRGTSQFTRTPRADPPPAGEEEAVATPAA
jgi:single-strand DNA-binding protein